MRVVFLLGSKLFEPVLATTIGVQAAGLDLTLYGKCRKRFGAVHVADWQNRFSKSTFKRTHFLLDGRMGDKSGSSIPSKERVLRRARGDKESLKG